MHTRILKLDYGTIAYEDQGSGPLVVAVPGLGDLRQEYRYLAPRLAAAGFRVVSMDLRGHGESSVYWPDYKLESVGEDILALIRHLQAGNPDTGPALVIGTSFSAGAVVYAAAEAPELVSGLVLIGMFVRDLAPLWQTRLLYGPLFSGPWAPGLWVRYYENTLYPGAKPDDFKAYLVQLRRMISEPGRVGAMRGMVLASKKAAEKRLHQVKAPSLLLVGDLDPDFKDPLEEAGWVAERLDGQVASVAGSGHYPHADNPDEAAAQILPFLIKVHASSVENPGREVAYVA